MGLNLFQIIPDGFFGILASPVKSIYSHILLLIYDMSRHYGFGIPRENLTEEIQEYLELLETGGVPIGDSEPLASEGAIQRGDETRVTAQLQPSALAQLLEKDLNENFDENLQRGVSPVLTDLNDLQSDALGDSLASPQPHGEETAALRSPRERANDIIRKFKRAGWIDIEVRSDYREIVVVPDYAMEILRALHKITSQEKPSYRGYVYGTYAALVEATEPRADAVNVAYEGTSELIGYLHSLYQNIKRYTKKILAQKRPQDILAIHFLEYQQEILDKAYHQLKTSDSVYKYRSRILHTVRTWKSDPAVISTLARNAVEEKLVAGSIADARSDMLAKLSFIEASYANIDEVLREIDRKNEQYARASLQQVKYFLNNSQDTEGKLINLLGLMGSCIAQRLIRKEAVFFVDRSFSLTHVGVLDSGSLYAPRKAREHVPAEIREEKPDDAAIEAAHRRLSRSLFRRITYEEIDNWVNQKLGERDNIRASEMNVESLDDFVRLIYAAAYSQNRRVSYTIEPLDSMAESADGLFRFTDVIVRRKPGSSQKKYPRGTVSRKELSNGELVPSVREHELKRERGLFEDT